MEKSLQQFGLSERESKIYLALLQLGETTVGPLAAKTRIQHSKVYQTLEKLIDKGLVSYLLKSKTKYFQAQSPKQILKMLKEKEQAFLEILPDLAKQQKNSQEQQTAKVYEGYKSIKSLFSSILLELNKKDFYYVFAFKQEYLNSETASQFLRSIHQQLSEKGIEDKLIAHDSIRKEFKINYENIKNIKFRFTNLNIPFGLIILPDKIINWTWSDRPTAIVTQSKQIAEQYKKFFLDLWKTAKF